MTAKGEAKTQLRRDDKTDKQAELKPSRAPEPVRTRGRKCNRERDRFKNGAAWIPIARPGRGTKIAKTRKRDEAGGQAAPRVTTAGKLSPRSSRRGAHKTARVLGRAGRRPAPAPRPVGD